MRHGAVHLVNIRYALAMQLIRHLREYGGEHSGIVGCAVMIEIAQRIVFAYRIKRVLGKIGIKIPRKRKCIQIGVSELYMVFLAGTADKSDVKSGIVRHKHSSAGKFEKLLNGLGSLRSAGNRFVGYSGKTGDIFGYRHLGIDIGAEFVKHLAAAVKHCTDFRYAAIDRRKTRSLYIKNNKLALVKRNTASVLISEHRTCGVVHKISLHAVYRLDIGIFFSRLHYRGERLRVSVIGYRNGGHAPFVSGPHYLLRVAKRVGRRHIGMQMKLYPSARSVVGPAQTGNNRHAVCAQHRLLLVIVVCGLSLYKQ